MIDLHCHILSSFDDAASDSAEALEMARIAVADGITVVAWNDGAERPVWSRPLAILDNLPPCEGLFVGAAQTEGR